MGAPKSAYARRFKEALRQFQNDKKLSVNELVSLAKKSRPTIFRWLKGDGCPGKSELRRLCHSFGWSYEAFFIEDITLDEIFNVQFLSYEALDRRYKQLYKRHPLQALAMVAVTANMVHAQLFYNNLQATCSTNTTLQSRIEFVNPQISKYHVTFFGSGDEGIKIAISDVTRKDLQARVYQATTDQMADMIKNFREAVYGQRRTTTEPT